MSKSFLTPIGLFSAATDPSSASIGNVYFNTASNVMRLYFNSQWNSVHNVTASYGLDADHIDFSTNPSSAASVARLQWSPGEGTLSFGLGGGNIFLNIGQEEVALCYNGTASTLTKGTVVYITGAQGQRPTINKASASAEGESSKTLGVVAEDIPSGSEGFVCTSGILRNVNTASFAEGSALWLSTTPGQMTTNKLYAPHHLVFIGYSIKQSAHAGQIFIKIQNGLELDELHNVSASAPANNNILVYNTSSSLWFNSSSANLTNLTVTNTINGRAASANVATHSGTASSIAGSLVTGYVASATVATHAGTASSIAGSLVTGTVSNASHANTASAINASLLTGTTLASNVVTSSLTSVGTLTNLTVTNTISGRSASATISSSAVIANHANTASSIAGSLVTGTVASATIASHAGTASSINSSLITGTTLPAAIVSSSLTGLGTLTSLTVSGNTNIDSGTLFVDATNNEVGIKTITPASALHVAGTSGVLIEAGLSVDGGTLFVDSANNEVGILTTTPASALHVAGGLLVNNNASVGGTIFGNLSGNASTASSIAGSLVTGYVASANVATHAGTASSINASLITGTTLPAGIVNSSLTSVGTLGSLTVRQATGGVVLQTDAGGNVNIGRIDNVASTPFIDFNSGATSVDYDVRIQVSGGNGTPGNGLLSITASQVNIDNGTFFVDGANNRVGIGTTAPASVVHILGGMLISASAVGTSLTSIKAISASGPTAELTRSVVSQTNPALIVGSNNDYTVTWRAVSFERAGTPLGYIQVSSAVGAPTLQSASDYRLKENIIDADVDYINTIKSLRPVQFEWKDKKMGIGKFKGFIADEVQEIIPEAVTGQKDEVDKDGNIIAQGLTEQPFTFYIVGALKEALDKIDELSARIQHLESK
jgi:hypothetical protein